MERFLAVFLRLAAVALFFGMGGYWTASALGERLLIEEMEGTSSLLNVPVARSLLPEASERPLTLREFVGGDPFRVNPPKTEETPQPVKEEKREITAAELFELEKIRLTGTMPDISVWVEEDGKQFVVLKGQTLKGYEVAIIEDDRIILENASNTLTVYLRYSIKPDPKRAASRASGPPPPLPAMTTMSAARPGMQGAVSRELVNQLLMDPLEEMNKFRMRPKFDGGEAQGVEVQWLHNSSVLASLGVQKGDVVQSVNGVEIKNMGDVVNVVNSLMSSNTFDVQVIRNGKQEMLNYNIK
jgi:type II secretion system protein C